MAKTYKYALVPLITSYLKFRFPHLKKVIVRNSLAEKNNFDAFLSDIDLTLIIENKSETKQILLTFLKLKTIFIMLDQPEIYEENEYQKLSELYSTWTADFIRFTWNFRKINWSLAELESSNNEAEKFKKLRSIKKSLSKISHLTDIKTPFILQDFSCFTRFKNLSHQDNKTICYWSQYLETSSGKGIQLLLDANEFKLLNSLMPGEPVEVRFNIPDVLQVKSALQYHELYLSMNTVRLRSALKKDITPWTEWIEHLHKQLGINS